MAQKVDKEFVQFVKSKNKRKSEGKDEEEKAKRSVFSSKKTQSINYLICDKTAKPNKENESLSIGDWLKENGKRVIVDKYKPNKAQLRTNDDSDEDNESDSDESDDYEEEKINHFVSKKRERDDEDNDAEGYEEENSEKEELETLKEMNFLSTKNEGDLIDDYEEDIDEEEGEDENIEEEANEEEEKEPEIKPKPKQRQQTKPKKEFKANISNTVFISNFPKTFTESDIEKYFSKYGDITTIRLMKTKEGESKGFCYIDFESTKGMKTAIEANLQIKGKAIKVEEANSSFINTSNDNSTSHSKRLGKKKLKAIKNKEKEAKRQRHRENQRQKANK